VKSRLVLLMFNKPTSSLSRIRTGVLIVQVPLSVCLCSWLRRAVPQTAPALPATRFVYANAMTDASPIFLFSSNLLLYSAGDIFVSVGSYLLPHPFPTSVHSILCRLSTQPAI
jgi:hypothetical protein